MSRRATLCVMGVSNNAHMDNWRNPIQSGFWKLVILVEIQGQAPRIMHFEPQENKELLRTYLTFLEDKKEEARTRYNLYKSRV